VTPRRNKIAAVLLASLIGVVLAACFFVGLSGGFRP
jgi:uncharacterized membrane protein YraQ (UPF0718 family)